jgi:hypothetical protein
MLAIFGVGSAPARQILGPVANKSPARQILDTVANKLPAPPAYALKFQNAPWSKVFEWLSNITGLPVVSPPRAIGAFTFVPPKFDGNDKKYTLPEIMDILNEALAKQQLVLVRRKATIGLWYSDEPIDADILPPLRVEDLANWGKTEIVRIDYQPTMVAAEALASHVKKMTGPLGQVMVSNQTGQLILVDTTANLRAMLVVINDLEDASPGEVWAHKCKHCLATEVAEKLKGMLRAPLLGKAQRLGIAVDETANIVFVSGPPETVALARAVVALFDVPHGPRYRRLGGSLVPRAYAVPGNDADVIVKKLQDIYKASPRIHITAVGPSVILVGAPPLDQMDIALLIPGCSPAPVGGALILLNEGDVEHIVNGLTRSNWQNKDALSIVAHPFVNGIIIKGSPNQIIDVRKMIEEYWPGSGSSEGGAIRWLPGNRDQSITAGQPEKKALTPPTYSFAFKNAPWTEVLQWLAVSTELPIVTTCRPVGTFTFLPPKPDGNQKRFALAEIIDFLNVTLAEQKLILVSRQSSIGLYPTGEPQGCPGHRGRCHAPHSDCSRIASADPRCQNGDHRIGARW